MNTCCTAPTATIRGVLVDLSGTLHVGAAPVGNAVAALRRLRERLPVRFVTNSSKQSWHALLAELNSCGFEGQIADSEIFSSLSAARRLVDGRRLRPLLLLHPDALPDFEGVDTAEPNAVIVGLAKEAFTYEVRALDLEGLAERVAVCIQTAALLLSELLLIRI